MCVCWGSVEVVSHTQDYFATQSCFGILSLVVTHQACLHFQIEYLSLGYEKNRDLSPLSCFMSSITNTCMWERASGFRTGQQFFIKKVIQIHQHYWWILKAKLFSVLEQKKPQTATSLGTREDARSLKKSQMSQKAEEWRLTEEPEIFWCASDLTGTTTKGRRKESHWVAAFPTRILDCVAGTVNFSCQAAVFSCCVSDSLVTGEPFIPLRSSSTPFSPLGLCSISAPHMSTTSVLWWLQGFLCERLDWWHVRRFAILSDKCAPLLYPSFISRSHTSPTFPSIFHSPLSICFVFLLLI